jgi:hypothetical protein
MTIDQEVQEFQVRGCLLTERVWQESADCSRGNWPEALHPDDHPQYLIDVGAGDAILMESYLTSNTVQVHYPPLFAGVQQELADHLPDDRSPMDGLGEKKSFYFDPHNMPV